MRKYFAFILIMRKYFAFILIMRSEQVRCTKAKLAKNIISGFKNLKLSNQIPVNTFIVVLLSI